MNRTWSRRLTSRLFFFQVFTVGNHHCNSGITVLKILHLVCFDLQAARVPASPALLQDTAYGNLPRNQTFRRLCSTKFFADVGHNIFKGSAKGRARLGNTMTRSAFLTDAGSPAPVQQDGGEPDVESGFVWTTAMKIDFAYAVFS